MFRKKLGLNTLLLLGMTAGFILGFALNLLTVGETGVRISEVSFGAAPFVEIANGHAREVDLSGWRLRLNYPEGPKDITLPAGTRAGPRRTLLVGGPDGAVSLGDLPRSEDGAPVWPGAVTLLQVTVTEDEDGSASESESTADYVAIKVDGGAPPRDWGAPLTLKEGEVSLYRRTLIDSGTAGDWSTSDQATPGALHDGQKWPRAFISNTLTGLLRDVLNLLGETIFIGLLKMVIVPVVLFSVITGIAGIGETSRVGSLGLKTVVYYLSTTFIAVTIGIVLVNIIQPGVGFEIRGQVLPESVVTGDGSFLDAILQIIRKLIPTNIFQAMANMDILPIIVFAILFGVVLLQMGESGKGLLGLLQTLNDLMMRMTKLVMKLGPIGVGALIAELVWLKIDIPELVYLIKYMVTVLTGLAIHAMVILPVILYLFGRVSPYRYAKQVSPALLTAFSTDSSSATLPVTLEVTHKRAGVPKNIGSFVLPLGATVNMDGTALYESVAAIFIAQAYLGHNLELGQQVVVFLTATLAAVGAAGIPSAGIVMMLIVLKALNLPAEGVALVLAVDRIVDQCRTTVNVWGDTVGAAVITRMEGRTLGEEGGEVSDTPTIAPPEDP